MVNRTRRILLPGSSEPDRSYGRFTGYQLKIIQECVTLTVFVVFAYFYLGEPVRWNYVLSFVCILRRVFFGLLGQHLSLDGIRGLIEWRVFLIAF